MKKLAVLLLLLVFLFSLVGCAAKTPQTTTPPQSTTATSPATTTEPSVLENLTLKILVANDTSGHDFRELHKYNVWAPFAQMCADRKLTIQWIVAEKEQYAATLMDYLLGDPNEMPDAFWCSEDVLPAEQRLQLVNNGKLYPLEDILPHSDGTASSWYENHPNIQNAKGYHGKTWWVSSYLETVWNGEALQPGQCLPKGVVFRLDWYNLLVQYGAWDASRGYPDTAQELGEFLELCNVYDVNGDNSRDEYYLSYISDMHSTGLGNLFGVPRNAFAPNLVTGTVDTAWTQPGSRELMELLIDWNSKGYFPEDLIGGKSGSTKYRTRNQTAVYNTYFCDNWGMHNTSVQEGAAPAVLCGVLPDLTVHPNAYIATDSPVTMDETSLCFTSNLSHPAAAAALLDLMYSSEFAHLLQWGTEGDTFEYVDGKEVLLPTGSDLSCSERYKVIGKYLFSYYVLPDVRELYDIREDELLCYPENSHDSSGEMHRVFIEALTQWTPTYPDQIDSFLAVATPEETMLLSFFEPIFQELSKEIFFDLITGKISMNQWDDCIQRLNEEGYMAQIQAVYQARYDRYLGK